MTDRLPGSVEGTVPSQWLLDEKVRRQRAEAESARLRATLKLVRSMALNGPGPGTNEAETLTTIAAFVEKRLAGVADND